MMTELETRKEREREKTNEMKKMIIYANLRSAQVDHNSFSQSKMVPELITLHNLSIQDVTEKRKPVQWIILMANPRSDEQNI